MSALHVVDGDLPLQAVFLRERPDPSRFLPVGKGRHPRKPAGGLWTSTYTGPDDISAWYRWASGNMPDMVDAEPYLFTPAPELRVVVVDSQDDGRALFEAYGSYASPVQHAITAAIDYERMAADGWDGLWVTEAGFHSSQREGSSMDFTCFDCESTIWFTWPATYFVAAWLVA
jgi:hypothetical protein